jgi:hypothetical protein
MLRSFLSRLLDARGPVTRTIRGIPVVVVNTRPDISTSDVLARIDGALELIERYQPAIFRRMRRDFARIVSQRYPCRGAYIPAERTCLVELTFTVNPEFSLPQVAATILHEATHNLGPAHEYKVNGKKADEAFGGPIASMMEELKAQTGALFLLEFLRKKQLISDEMATGSYVDAIVWAFGHISQGMYTGDKSRKAYGNLAAIHIGYLLDKGALTWDANAMAAAPPSSEASVRLLASFSSARRATCADETVVGGAAKGATRWSSDVGAPDAAAGATSSTLARRVPGFTATAA